MNEDVLFPTVLLVLVTNASPPRLAGGFEGVSSPSVPEIASFLRDNVRFYKITVDFERYRYMSAVDGV